MKENLCGRGRRKKRDKGQRIGAGETEKKSGKREVKGTKKNCEETYPIVGGTEKKIGTMERESVREKQ